MEAIVSEFSNIYNNFLYYIVVVMAIVLICSSVYYVLPIGKRKGAKPRFFLAFCLLIFGLILGSYGVNELLIYYDVTDTNYVIKPLGILISLVFISAGINDLSYTKKLTTGYITPITGKIIMVKTYKGTFTFFTKYLPVVEYYIGQEKRTYTQKKALAKEFRYLEGDDYILRYNQDCKEVFADVDLNQKKKDAVFLILIGLFLAAAVVFIAVYNF